MNQKSLYERLGSYDGITAFTNDLLPRLQNDPQLGRFWQNRGEDGIKREHRLSLCQRWWPCVLHWSDYEGHA